MISTVLIALTLAVVYWFPIRRWMGRWGATSSDLTRVMAGDAVIVNPTHSATHAVTVDAPADDIWPWLVQMGYQRGGLYSYDWLDRLFGILDRPSANRILPEFQHLAVGDKILLGPGEKLTVTALEPPRALVLSYKAHGFEWVWQFGMYPLDNQRTRLVSRGTERVPNTVVGWLFMRVMEPAALVMTRRMLLGLKERAETRPAARGASWKDAAWRGSRKMVTKIIVWLAVAIGLTCVAPSIALGHCDSLDGPVVKAAQRALETRELSGVLIWVRAADEPEIRAAFEQTLAVRVISAQAKELADRYFFETLVRVHRAGEGAPYTGLKAAGRDLGPAIPAADRAIEEGSLQPVVTLLTSALDAGLARHFEEVITAKHYKPGDVRAGREYIQAYVEFIHYVERLYEAIATPAQGHFSEAVTAAPRD